MRLLLTSQGFTNDSIKQSLYDLSNNKLDGKRCVFVPTASTIYSGDKSWVMDVIMEVRGLASWSEFDIVDLAADGIQHTERLLAADVIVVWGGSEYFLNYWLSKRVSKDDLMNILNTKIWVGASAGSMVLGKSIPYPLSNEVYSEYTPEEVNNDQFQEFVDFAILPHFGSTDFEGTTQENMLDIARKIGPKVYLLDDQSAIKVDGDDIGIVSEGEWRLYEK